MKRRLALMLTTFGILVAPHAASVTHLRASQGGSQAVEGARELRVASHSNQAARIDSISPSSARPGDQVTIRGNGFGGRNVAISVGGAAAQVVDATGNTVTFLVPATASSGLTLVTATNPGGRSGSIAFTVEPLFKGSVIVSVDELRQVSALIGPAGGELSTTTASGAALTLTIPAGALVGEEQVSISPVAAIEGLPLSGGLLAAAHFAPEGLLLFKPATLTIQLPPGTSTQRAVGFAYESNGNNFHLTPLNESGGTLTLLVSHFSGAGVGTGTTGNVNAIASAPQTQLEAHYLNLMVQAEANLKAQICGPSGLCTEDALVQALTDAVEQSRTNLLSDWFVTGLRPLLIQASTSTDALRKAAREFAIWHAQVESKLCFISDCPPPVPSYVEEGREALGAGFLAEILRVNVMCDDTELAKLVAEILLLALEGYGGLPDDVSDIVNTYSCALVINVGGGFPSQINIGQSVPFNVKLSRHHEGQLIPVADTEVKLKASGCGFLGGGSSILTGVTDGGGSFMTQVTGSALCDGQDLVVITAEVEDATDPPGSANVLFYGQTRQFSATVRAGVSISPQSVMLSQGQTQQFTATVTGAVNTGVTWSVTGGGSINQTGLYTAGSTGATVKATSIADPSKSATASVSLGIQVTVTPASVTVPAGTTAQFAATVTGTANQSVTWSATGGTITQGGLFTAGATTGEYFVTATSMADPNAAGVAQIRITTPGHVRLTRRHSELFADAVARVDLVPRVQDVKSTVNNSFGEFTDQVVANAVASDGENSATASSQASQTSGLNVDATGRLSSANFNGSSSLSTSVTIVREGTSAGGRAKSVNVFSVFFEVVGAPVRYQITGTVDANTANGTAMARYQLVGNYIGAEATSSVDQPNASAHLDISDSGELAPGLYQLFIEVICDGFGTTSSANASGNLSLTFTPATGQP